MTDNERLFIAQSDEFIRRLLPELGVDELASAPKCTNQWARPVVPIVIQDYHAISEVELQAIVLAYNSSDGVAAIVTLNPHTPSVYDHPLFEIVAQCKAVLPLNTPLPHPLEKHPETIRHFGKADGTVKVYDLAKPQGTGYREQGETADAFDVHHDGLAAGGAVEAFVLYCDRGPLWGGFTYFQNVCLLSLELAREDPEAFKSLFLPDALTILRPRGKGAIRVVTPVLYLNEAGRPQSSYRRASGEYRVTWRDDPALRRAKAFLERFTLEFSPGSTFVQLNAPGQCCIVRNEVVAHGRTRFIDRAPVGQGRCLSRKWFMRRPQDGIYKHVPGMLISPTYAGLFPTLFGDEVLSGEWLYDEASGANVKQA
ncbi:MAG: TauD/TfdA family dioxygenase [Vicinamibacteria bacterium]|nr:TauD/TfdA family dioxygenase [Vicinamibacteria bacterium]